ncbi:hypothetical protein DFJ77DRAFT_369746 [Powellomyces hirtus]|nr:hypothetical protein DFJ77DRAFT_369746 [Powellomyces hirtus]
MSPRALDALLAYLASPAAPQCWTREHGQLQGQAQDQRDYTEFCEPGEEREAAKVALLAVVRAAADDNLTEVKRNAIYAIIDLPHFPAAINLFADNDTQLFTLLLHLLHLSASRTHPNQIHLPPHLSPHVLFETFVAHPAHHDSSFLVDLVIAEPVLLEYLLAYLRFAAVTSSKTPERSVSVLKTFANEVQLLDRRGLFPFRPDPILVRINALLKPQS